MTAHTTSEIHSTDRPLPCPTCGEPALRMRRDNVTCRSCEALFTWPLIAESGWYCFRRDAVLAYSTRCTVIRRVFKAALGLTLAPWDLAGGCFALSVLLPDGREVMIGDGDGNLPDDERYMDVHGYTLCAQVAFPDEDDAPALYTRSVADCVRFVREAMANPPAPRPEPEPAMDFDTAEALGLDGTLRSGEIAQQLRRAADVADEPEPVTVALTPGALDLLSDLLDVNDDDAELAEQSGATLADVAALREAVTAARGR